MSIVNAEVSDINMKYYYKVYNIIILCTLHITQSIIYDKVCDINMKYYYKICNINNFVYHFENNLVVDTLISLLN